MHLLFILIFLRKFDKVKFDDSGIDKLGVPCSDSQCEVKKFAYYHELLPPEEKCVARKVLTDNIH